MTAIKVRLPDGRLAVADHRDPIVPVMRRVLAAHCCSRQGRAADYQAIGAWLDGQQAA